MDVISRITVKVSLNREQITFIKNELKDGGLTYKALSYAEIHYNTLFKRALKGKPIKKSQRDKLIRFFELVKQEKAA